MLISDFDNRAGDAAFDGAVEQALGTALEAASFITIYPRRQAQQIAAQQIAAQSGAGERIDEAMARLISRREGIKVVVTGSVEPEGSGYRVTATALDPALEGQAARVLATATATADDKDGVLKAAAAVAAELRADLGDKTPESERLAAAETFTAGSLEAMRAYVRGQELNRTGKPEKHWWSWRRRSSWIPSSAWRTCRWRRATPISRWRTTRRRTTRKRSSTSIA